MFAEKVHQSVDLVYCQKGQTFIRVLLPDPDGPMMAVNSFAWKSHETHFKIVALVGAGRLRVAPHSVSPAARGYTGGHHVHSKHSASRVTGYIGGLIILPPCTKRRHSRPMTTI
eukprot:8125626-Pyramimonas_sp.AAC.4